MISCFFQYVCTFVIKNSLPGVIASLQVLVFNVLKRLDQITIVPLSGSAALGKNPNMLP